MHKTMFALHIFLLFLTVTSFVIAYIRMMRVKKKIRQTVKRYTNPKPVRQARLGTVSYSIRHHPVSKCTFSNPDECPFIHTKER